MAPEDSTSPQDYLRQARRLRMTYAHNPAQLHQKLQQLATERQSSTPATASKSVRRTPNAPASPSLFTVPPSLAERFAAEVESALDGPLLRYTARTRLIARAHRLGLSRFDANLIIASVLHAHATPLPLPHEAPVEALSHAKKAFKTLTYFLAAQIVLASLVYLCWH